MKNRTKLILSIVLVVIASMFCFDRIIEAVSTQNVEGNILWYGTKSILTENTPNLFWRKSTSGLEIGQNGSTAGSLKLWGSTSGSTTIVANATGVANVALTATGSARYCTGGGLIPLATAGTNTTLAAATTFEYLSEIDLPLNKTLTGVSVLAGGTAGAANHWAVALFGTTSGLPLVQTVSTTVASAASTNAFYDIPFSATYAATGPARYFVAFQTDGTTDKIQTAAAANSWGNVFTAKPATTAFGTFPSLTVPSTFTADVGPIACLY